MPVCDFCFRFSIVELAQCRCFHSFCDECANVSSESQTTNCDFCPKCSVECEIKNYVAAVCISRDPEPLKEEEMLKDTPPSEYICPITREIMDFPVVLSDGFSYERDAIAKWMCINDTSPITGAKVESMMIPNTVLRIVINEWKEKNRV
jgi:hypothetical protein